MKKIFGIVCSLLILISSMGITISEHYCGNVFQQQSVLGIPLDKNDTSTSCADEEKGDCCAQNEEQENCCSSDLQIVEADIDLFKTSQNEQSVDFQLHIEYSETTVLSNPHTEFIRLPIQPDIVTDLQVLYQNFLC